MLRVVSDPRYTLTLKKSVGQADSQRLQPTQLTINLKVNQFL
jgi:hypothetical protein